MTLLNLYDEGHRITLGLISLSSAVFKYACNKPPDITLQKFDPAWLIKSD